MPYSDLSDAWNSYDPRYHRVTDDDPRGGVPYEEAEARYGKIPPGDRWVISEDKYELAPGQYERVEPRYPRGQPLNLNEIGIFPGLLGSREPPVGDQVIPSERQPFVNTMPRADYVPLLTRSEYFFRPMSYNPGGNSLAEFDPSARSQYESGSEIQGPTRPGYNDPTVLARVYGDIQRDLKLSPDQALGFLSNLNAESFGFTLPQEVGPQIKGRNTGGLGWGQWTASRRGNFEDYLKQTGMPPTSYEGNYGYLTSELQKPEWQPFLENLRRQKGAENATRYTERVYENPSRKTGRQDWLARTRRELPASQRALGVPQEAPLGQGAAQLPPNQLVGPGNYLKRIGMNEDQDEADRRFDERMRYLDKRTNAYGDWTKQAPIDEIEEAGPFGAPRFYTSPMAARNLPRDMGYGYGYNEGEKMPISSSRLPGLDALIGEQVTTHGDVPREQPLVDALRGIREGLSSGRSVEDLSNFLSGNPINFLKTRNRGFLGLI